MNATLDQTVTIDGLRLSTASHDETVSLIRDWMGRSGSRRVATANASFLRLASASKDLAACLEKADLVTIDGFPVALLARIVRGKPVERVAGSDLLGDILANAAADGRRVYFFGGHGQTAAIAAGKAVAKHPDLVIVGAEGPEVRLDDEACMQEITDRIARAKPDLLLVGLGCPKQELFLSRYGGACGARVGIGLGGSFDFLSGRRQRAARWVQACGLEWLHRLVLEPRRLAGRYAADMVHLTRVMLRIGLASRDHAPLARK